MTNPTFVAQAGGDHYQAEFQHWDFVIAAKIGYLQANATKYVGRWRKKNGKQDLAKALTYVEKLVANFEDHMVTMQSIDANYYKWMIKWFDSAGLSDMERYVCQMIVEIESTEDALNVARVMATMITQRERLEAHQSNLVYGGGNVTQGAATPAPAPAADVSGHPAPCGGAVFPCPTVVVRPDGAILGVIQAGEPVYLDRDIFLRKEAPTPRELGSFKPRGFA